MEEKKAKIENPEQYISAITTMYTTKDKYEIEAANKLLMELNKSNRAWIITRNTLILPNLEEKVYFFAAKSMTSKIMYDLSELNSSDLPM